MIMSGFTPNIFGFQSTRSASFPTSTEPTYCEIPCVIAGLMVYFATYLLILKLSFLSQSCGNAPLCFFILSAVCHVLVMTSPTRPIACESELIIEKIPISCRTSSAAIVSGRILESANAISSGTFLSRWWQTISISRCSSSVFFVKGMVGLVDDGSTFSNAAAFMISGACPPPAPSVWYVWIVLPLNALIVSSTKPASFKVSVCMAACTSYSSQTLRQWSIASGVLPQSSCSFNPHAPALICSLNVSISDEFPFPRKPRLIGSSSAASSILSILNRPGEHVVAFVPSAGPVPPPIIVVIPL